MAVISSWPVRRSTETWPPRDSVLLAGLLAFVGYLLVALIVFGKFPVVTDSVIAAVAAPIWVLAAAELSHGLKPSAPRLARSDRCAIVAFGVWSGISIVCCAVLLVQSVAS